MRYSWLWVDALHYSKSFVEFGVISQHVNFEYLLQVISEINQVDRGAWVSHHQQNLQRKRCGMVMSIMLPNRYHGVWRLAKISLHPNSYLPPCSPTSKSFVLNTPPLLKPAKCMLNVHIHIHHSRGKIVEKAEDCWRARKGCVLWLPLVTSTSENHIVGPLISYG